MKDDQSIKLNLAGRAKDPETDAERIRDLKAQLEEEKRAREAAEERVRVLEVAVDYATGCLKGLFAKYGKHMTREDKKNLENLVKPGERT